MPLDSQRTRLERRKRKRFQLSLSGTILLNVAGKEAEYQAQVQNISALGAYLLTKCHPLLGDTILVRLKGGLEEQSHTTLQALGTVLRVDPLPDKRSGCAVQFHEPLDADDSSLVATLKEHEQENGDCHLYLRVGSPVSLQLLSRQECVAIVSAIDPTGLSLEIVRSPTPWPFQEKDRLLIKYWDEGAVAYYWKAEVDGTAPNGSKLEVSILGKGVTVQRRNSYRFQTPLPFSCRVVEASDDRLIGKELLNCTTKNVSVNGLLFETTTPLQVGDKLGISFLLPPDEKLNALGWVVRSTPFKDGGNPNAMAVMFLQLEERDQLHLLQYLATVETEG